MPKAKRKKSSDSAQKLRLKKGVNLTKHEPLKALLNEKLIAQAFLECLKDNDCKGAM